MNEVLSVDYCLQPSFPVLIAKDLAAHGESYSQKARDLLNELVALARLSRAVNYYSVITLYERLEEIYHAVRSNQTGEAYWMQCAEAELLVTTVRDQLFKKGEDWLEPPLKWKELNRTLEQLDKEKVGETVVLVHVMNAKSMMEIHNYLIDPAVYMSGMLRRALSRVIAYNASSSLKAERELLKNVRERLSRLEKGQEEGWTRHCCGYQFITETLDSGESCIEVHTGRCWVSDSRKIASTT